MNKQVAPWVIREDCAIRHIAGTDPDDVRARVAFIEKTPRVRIREHYMGTQRLINWLSNEPGREERLWPEHCDWCYGDKGNGPDDEESQQWCDAMLKLLGYTLEN